MGGKYHECIEGYHECIGGYHECIGETSSMHWWFIISALGLLKLLCGIFRIIADSDTELFEYQGSDVLPCIYKIELNYKYEYDANRYRYEAKWE